MTITSTLERDSPNQCATCGRRLGANAYGQQGKPGLYCSTKCLAKAKATP